MAESRIKTLQEVFRPRLIRIGSGALASLFAYDAASNQFGIPKIPALWGMSGSLLPWWGWLLILQAIFVYAIFEYVRRAQAPGAYDDAPLQEKIGSATSDVARQLQNLLETVKPALQSQIETNNAFGRRFEKLETQRTAPSVPALTPVQSDHLLRSFLISAMVAREAAARDEAAYLQQGVRFASNQWDQFNLRVRQDPAHVEAHAARYSQAVNEGVQSGFPGPAAKTRYLLGADFSYNASPNYSKDPMRPVEGEEAVREEHLFIYRRLFDEHKTYVSTLEEKMRDREGEVSWIQERLQALGRQVDRGALHRPLIDLGIQM